MWQFPGTRHPQIGNESGALASERLFSPLHTGFLLAGFSFLMPPPSSLLIRQKAEDAKPVCSTQASLLAVFGVSAILLIIVNTGIVATPRPTMSSAEVAGIQRRRHLASDALARATAMAVEAASPPPPPPPTSQPSPAGVADGTCHARLHTDYMGEQAPVWGLGNPGFHLKDAAECCAACQAHAAVCGKPDSRGKSWWPLRPELKCYNNPGCNIWVFCPEKQCFAFDIHVHTQGECWLKYQRANVTRPKDPHEGHTTFPEAMRKSPRAIWPWAVEPKIWPGGIPKKIPWISGVLAPADAMVTSAPADDGWRKRWCDKHGAEHGGC